MTGLTTPARAKGAAPSISVIGPDQWQTLKALRLAALEDSPRAFLGNCEEESRRKPDDWRAECSSSTWVSAEVAGRSVGLAKLAQANDPEVSLHIEAMWVHPTSRGSGIAEAMVQKLEELARGRGEEVLGLWVFDGNQVARDLYLRLGYNQVGEKGNRQLIPSTSDPGSLIWEEELRKSLVGEFEA